MSPWGKECADEPGALAAALKSRMALGRSAVSPESEAFVLLAEACSVQLLDVQCVDQVTMPRAPKVGQGLLWPAGSSPCLRAAMSCSGHSTPW